MVVQEFLARLKEMVEVRMGLMEKFMVMATDLKEYQEYGSRNFSNLAMELSSNIDLENQVILSFVSNLEGSMKHLSDEAIFNFIARIATLYARKEIKILNEKDFEP